MYTQCPECRIAFRITAAILQKAGGKVRCGNCNHAFNALAFLSEKPPAAGMSDATSEKLAATSRRLLDTLNELAGPDDVRIEDTGVEWRVVDGEDNQRRYDDNSPLPDDIGDEEEDDYVPPLAAADAAGSAPTDAEIRFDLTLSEPDEWSDLLDEIRDPDSDSLAVEEELAAIHSELAERGDPRPPAESVADYSAATGEIDATDIAAPDDGEWLTDDVPIIDEPRSEIAEDGRDSMADGVDDAAFEIEQAPQADETGELTLVDDELLPGEDRHSPGTAGSADHEVATSREALPAGGPGEPDHAIDVSPTPTATGPDESAAGDVETAGSAATWQEQPDEAADLAEPAAAGGEPETTKPADDGITDGAAEPEPVLTMRADGAVTAEPERENPQLYVPEPTEDELTVNMEIDQELLSAASAAEGLSATLVGMNVPRELLGKKPEEFETIIMEGEVIRTADDEDTVVSEKAARDQIEGARLADTYAKSRGDGKSRRFGVHLSGRALIGVVVGLSVLLALQWVHYSRDSLATYAFFNRTVAPVYRMLGIPVTPQWDIRGWRFEATNGSMDDEQTQLTIVTRLGNASGQPLPYPLIHLSLTDRFEEVMGSRVLEPGQYLADDVDPSQPVPPGDNFTAVITVAEPSVEATGFKLNACYRIEQGTVRCAIEDFRN